MSRSFLFHFSSLNGGQHGIGHDVQAIGGIKVDGIDLRQRDHRRVQGLKGEKMLGFFLECLLFDVMWVWVNSYRYITIVG